MRVELINPFILAARDVFSTMLGCSLTRGQPQLLKDHASVHEVSGLIGLSGSYRGMVVVSVGRETALRVAEIMLGTPPAQVDADVMDAVGELTNMIGGGAKTRLEEYQLTIGLPTVICGQGQSIMFPSGTSPIVIPFDSDIGPVSVQVGMVASFAAVDASGRQNGTVEV